MQFTPKEKYMCTLELVDYFRGIALSLNFFVKLNSLFLVKSTVQLQWDANSAINIYMIPLKNLIKDFSTSALLTFWAAQLSVAGDRLVHCSILATFLASTHWMPAAPSKPWKPKMIRSRDQDSNEGMKGSTISYAIFCGQRIFSCFLWGAASVSFNRLLIHC